MEYEECKNIKIRNFIIYQNERYNANILYHNLVL